MVSTKDFNLQGEFHVVNDIKEKTSFVCESSEIFSLNMEKCRLPNSRNPLLREYLLPDYKKIKTGYLLNRDDGPQDLKDQSIVNVTNEQFLVPEVLFSPNDIGINQGGIADTIK